MIWLSDTTAVLNCAEEIGLHYNRYAPILNQFSLVKPYQSKEASADKETVAEGGLESDSGDANKDEENNVSPGSRRNRKRKRIKKSSNNPVAHAKQEEGNQRHALYEQLLLDAYQIFTNWVEGRRQQIPNINDHDNKPSFGCRHQAAGSQQESQTAAEIKQNSPTAPEALDELAENADSFDLTALSELKHVVKPKFEFHSSGAAVDLFDTLIENPDDADRLATAFTTHVVIPRHSRFLISDVKHLQPLLAGCPEAGYDCIVMDPPWENKSVKRSGHYPTLPSRHLLSIPVPHLLKQEGGLLALWVTNRERLRRFVEQELLPHWGLEQVATWFWLKVTNSGQLVSPLEVAHRRPYEALLLARPRPSAALRGAGQEQRHAVPDMVFFAVPGEHSRKPHLGRLLARHLPAQPACLEIFARELAAGWTSWGNEALRFQTLDHFNPL